MRTLIVLLSLLLASCATTVNMEPGVELAGGHYQLQTVPEAMRFTGILEQLHVRADGKEHQLLVQTEMTTDAVNMVGLSLDGLPLFTLHWQGTHLTTDYHVPGIELPAEQILAYFQLARWPLEDIQGGLYGMTLEGEQGDLRTFQRDGKKLFTLTKKGKVRVLQHFGFPLTITIDTLESWQIEP